ncbi:hypothetical protein B617_gp44 [Nonlabens phage P12024S]|uniref:Uncharacterized protein n=1 Tax=Nonlabens phage P12024S TaxID=1168478 RepID=I6S6P3_9CAUD|nr:hypothetical protein B617_gp44 [Nonlabens phage P12024S]AFM54705.1 hypothetical protein P12024S_44 [Nonlabens phage P12024S]
MATFSEIDITFLDSFEVNTATNVLSIGYTDNQTGTSLLINETIVTTRSQSGEFSVGTDANTQAQNYKDALDLDIVPSGDWEVSISGATITVKSTLDFIQFRRAAAGAPNDTRITGVIRNYTIPIERTGGILPARSNYYINRDINDAAITQQTVKIWVESDQFNDDYAQATPNYTATQLRPSSNWNSFDFAVSQYARDFINPTLPDLSASLEPSEDGSVIAMSVSTRNNQQATDQPILNQVITTLGYSGYNLGAKPIYNRDILLCSTINQVKKGEKVVVPIFTLGGLSQVVLKGSDGTTIETVNVAATNFIKDAISYAIFSTDNIDDEYVTVNDQYRFELINECKYDTEVVYFLNRYGAFEGLTFFKTQKKTVQVERFGAFKNNYVEGGVYSNKRHLYRNGGVQGRETLQLSSGYVSEAQNAQFEDLLLSDYVFLSDNSPINVDTNSIEKKTRIVDKLISYDISFKRSSDLIQTV